MAAKTRFSHAHAVKAFLEWGHRNFYAVSIDLLTILTSHLRKPKQAGKRVSLTDAEIAALLATSRLSRERASDYWCSLVSSMSASSKWTRSRENVCALYPYHGNNHVSRRMAARHVLWAITWQTFLERWLLQRVGS